MQVFYIITSIACVPLLMHRRTSGAIQASVYYMVYFAAGQLFIHFGGKYIMRYMDSEEFVEGGSLNLGLLEGHEGMFMAMVFLLLLGFGIKACVFPFHNWHKVMTQAAPMPAVSAISGILTKIGVIAMIRVTCNMTGMRILRGTWVQTGLDYPGALEHLYRGQFWPSGHPACLSGWPTPQWARWDASSSASPPCARTA